MSETLSIGHTWPGLEFGGAYPCVNEIAKTADYQIKHQENQSLFTNDGAAGPVTFTLPPIRVWHIYLFRVVADQTVTIQSAEGGNIIAFNNASASSVAFSTANKKVGGELKFYSNADGNKWYVQNYSAGDNTITVA